MSGFTFSDAWSLTEEPEVSVSTVPVDPEVMARVLSPHADAPIVTEWEHELPPMRSVRVERTTVYYLGSHRRVRTYTVIASQPRPWD